MKNKKQIYSVLTLLEKSVIKEENYNNPRGAFEKLVGNVKNTDIAHMPNYIQNYLSQRGSFSDSQKQILTDVITQLFKEELQVRLKQLNQKISLPDM